MVGFSASAFPRVTSSIKGSWAPVILHPILGSPEQFIVGVAAANAHAFYVEPANALRRLTCLYGRAADTAIWSVEIALFALEARLAKNGIDGLSSRTLALSNVSLGAVQQGEAESLQSLARTWIAALSSLHRAAGGEHLADAESDDDTSDRGVPDRLPSMVFAHIFERRPGLADFFSDEIRKGQQRRSRSITRVSIDFAGSNLVANFATLKPTQRASSVDRIKRKAFDLIVKRDEESSRFDVREHEMIVFNPVADSPLYTPAQINHVEDDLQELADQSEREKIGFRTVNSIAEIGNRLLSAENAY